MSLKHRSLRQTKNPKIRLISSNKATFLSIFLKRPLFFLKSFPECANTEQFRTAGSQKKIGFNFYQLTEESNPGQLGEKREGYLCAMPSPLKRPLISESPVGAARIFPKLLYRGRGSNPRLVSRVAPWPLKDALPTELPCRGSNKAT